MVSSCYTQPVLCLENPDLLTIDFYDGLVQHVQRIFCVSSLIMGLKCNSL